MRIGWFRVSGRRIFFCGKTTISEGDLDTLSRIFSTYYRGVFRVTWLMHLTIALPRARKGCVYRCQGVTFPPPTTYISAVTMDFSALTMDFGKRKQPVCPMWTTCLEDMHRRQAGNAGSVRTPHFYPKTQKNGICIIFFCGSKFHQTIPFLI